VTEYRYFKVHPDAVVGHLPANKELMGVRVGYPEAEQYNIYRYPATTTIFFGLMMASHNTYQAARDGAYYEGQDA
jgi:hypothetical protein